MSSGVPWVSQEVLVHKLREVFGNVHTHVNTKKKANLKYPSSGTYLELDVWIPDLNLSFEFQDTYHYTTTWYSQVTRDRIKQKDRVKRYLSHERGISLVVVPCWWDGTVNSLISTIHFYRPDLLAPSGISPILLNPPLGFFKPRYIPDVGELMLASFPTEKFDIKPAQRNTWWMGEKYDGIRCCNNPFDRLVYSRGGNELSLENCIMENIPKTFIDGEFWFGRGNYIYTYALFKGSLEMVCWDLLRLVSFDAPSEPIQHLPFENRYADLLAKIDFQHPFTIVVPRIKCKSNEHLSQFVQGVIDAGGEGVILRKMNSLYEHGRSRSLVKLKTVYGDMEGVVVAIAPNKSVQLKIPSGVIFTVPPENIQTKKLTVGDVVTFSYESNARRDVPISPKIYRIRTDLSWREVVENAAAEKKFLNEHVPVNFTSKPQGHWSPKNMRKFLENFAKAKNLDPLLPETWSKIQPREIHETKDGKSVLQKLKGYPKAVVSLFPEIGLHEDTLLSFPRGSIEIRRIFFENYAKINNFDPQIAENWYAQPVDLLMSHKGAANVIYHHKSLARALEDVYPNIGLDSSKLWNSTLWHKEEARRKFFENYAKTRGFDPLVSDNWYSQSKIQIMATKGASKVIFYHGRSVAQALVDLFPNIGLRIERFWPANFSWRDVQNRRDFFEKFARDRGFDPHNTQMWYSLNQESILSLKGAANVISFHQRSLPQALVDLFPNIGLNIAKFSATDKWKDAAKRRRFFENYAKEKGFDARNPEGWYTQSKNRLMASQGVVSIISHHKGSVAQALSDLFPDIGFDKSKLWSRSIWRDAGRRRKFFENYAQAHAFDPLVPENWYCQPAKSIMAIENAVSVMNHHNDNVPKALLDLFPDIGLESSKFSTQPMWNEFDNRKKFFLQFAKDNGFDPHNPNNWYSQRRHKLYAAKGAFSIMNYHNGRASTALLEIFPDIGLEAAKIPF
eukprot:Phypoly_transcript_00539.p1 GENE.Phypoly_transcript_00539~~Phypoly_transcript_00539.p1  ORF type:complete len:959 (+),score=132.38 Phypoly_transcript_00539:57-2933(+)